jgi:hypothetical protein
MISLDRLTVTLVTPRHAHTLPALLVLVAQSHMHHTSMLQSLLRAALLLAPARAHCPVSSALPEFQALTPTTTERLIDRQASRAAPNLVY